MPINFGEKGRSIILPGGKQRQPRNGRRCWMLVGLIICGIEFVILYQRHQPDARFPDCFSSRQDIRQDAGVPRKRNLEASRGARGHSLEIGIRLQSREAAEGIYSPPSTISAGRMHTRSCAYRGRRSEATLWD